MILVNKLKAPLSHGARMAGRKRTVPNTTSYSGRFAAHLQELLDASGMTVPELAHKVGVTDNAAWTWLSGRYVPPLDRWPKIAKALGLKSVRLLAPEK